MSGGRVPDVRLIVITDSGLAAPRTVSDVVRSAVEAGAPAIQLRDKSAGARELAEAARVILRLTRAAGAALYINDRLDVAIAVGADGVHLGPDDMPVAAARRIAPPDMFIGYSTDSPQEAVAAAGAGASYIGCGAVFGTTTKPEAAGECIGPARLGEVVRAVNIPVVGIGGISLTNVRQIAEAGAAGAAVVGAVMAAADPGKAVRGLLEPFGG